jgi:hypothetical protein
VERTGGLRPAGRVPNLFRLAGLLRANSNNHYGSCREGDNVAIKENGYPGMERDRMMEYHGAARQRTRGASSFSADECMESGPPCDGPAGWPEWKIEDHLAYQQYLDEVFKGDTY